jgi:adenylosuccinate synthase
MPYHTFIEGLEEDARGGKAIGTTRKGIGPAFADKTARMGIRTGDLLDKEVFKERLGSILEYKNAIISKVYERSPLSFDEVYSQYCRYGERMAPYIQETTLIIEEALNRGESVLLEGAQGTLLDPDFGTYPYVTSSSPLSGGSSIGAGIGFNRINTVLGVFKAYITRVGAGPMPTRLKDEAGELIRERGQEYGTVSGRARDCGWFDAVAARLSMRINGFTGAVITNLDILDTFPYIKICTAYELDGKKIDYFPDTIAALERCQPVYEEWPGWQTDTTDITSYENLPEKAKNYLTRLEELIGCPLSLISVGQKRKQTIVLGEIW